MLSLPQLSCHPLGGSNKNNIMKYIFLFASILLIGCSSSYPPEETLQLHITDEWAEVVNCDSLTSVKSDDSITTTYEPEIVFKVVPKYPIRELKHLHEADIFVKVLVTTKGNVRKAIIISSTEKKFNRAVLLAAVQWQFKPIIENGNPVEAWVNIPFRFRAQINF
jgi:TonB family protein